MRNIKLLLIGRSKRTTSRHRASRQAIRAARAAQAERRAAAPSRPQLHRA
ncbi:hypothetical protein [Nocardioides sp. InS609-2]|nr:hypothetical protein [Nocardioides sp. InS609-2]